MKIGLFSDPHYYVSDNLGGGRNGAASYEKIKKAMGSFKENNVDICFCLGDLTDCKEGDTKESIKENLENIISLINSYEIPFFLVAGNHDFLILKKEDYKEAKINTLPLVIDNYPVKFILLDANFLSDMQHFCEGGVIWYDSNLPKEQLNMLREELENTDKPTIVLVHENLDPTVYYQCVIKNAEDARKIIKDSGKVKMVIQGHHHSGNYIEIDNIPYLTVKGMCENDEDYYLILDV